MYHQTTIFKIALFCSFALVHYVHLTVSLSCMRGDVTFAIFQHANQLHSNLV